MQNWFLLLWLFCLVMWFLLQCVYHIQTNLNELINLKTGVKNDQRSAFTSIKLLRHLQNFWNDLHAATLTLTNTDLVKLFLLKMRNLRLKWVKKFTQNHTITGSKMTTKLQSLSAYSGKLSPHWLSEKFRKLARDGQPLWLYSQNPDSSCT